MAPEANDTRIDMPWHSAGETVEMLGRAPAPGGSTLRMRRITLEPGGVIAAHDHGNRPVVSWIQSGTLLEFRADLPEAVEHHGPATVTAEVGHWFRNAGDEPAVIIEADLREAADEAPRD